MDILIALAVFIGMCLYYFATNKIAKRKEENLPDEAKILECLEGTPQKNMGNTLHSLGAKMIFYDSDFMCSHPNIVVLTKQSIFFKSQFIKKYVTPPKTKSSIRFSTQKIVYSETKEVTKNKSVVGRAVAGGAIAGGVGAVVGAMSGLSNDGKKTVTQTNSYSTDLFRLIISCKTEKFTCYNILIDNQIINQIGVPDASIVQVQNPTYTDTNYTLFDTSYLNSGDLQKILNYIENAISI